MTPEQEKQLLQSLYDRILDAVSYTPNGKEQVFDKDTTLVQLSKNEAINAADFANQVTPMNPQEGNLTSAEYFSGMVDDVPVLMGDYTPSGTKLSQVYQRIVMNADTKAQVDPTQQQTYDAAYKFLNTTTSIQGFDKSKPPKVTTGPSEIADSYNKNQLAYVTAIGGYRSAQNGYDLKDPKQQRQWQAVAPALQLNIDQAWNNWVRQGKDEVEEAQNAMAATINNIVSSIINANKAVMDPNTGAWLASGMTAGRPWLLSYPLPGDWTDEKSRGATDFNMSSTYMHTESNSKFTAYGGGASFNEGLWNIGGSFNHSEGSKSFHMDANNVTISAKLRIVRIMRPWLDMLLFRTKGWWESEQPENSISNGKFEGNSGGMLPLVPVAFVTMNDVTINADFSAQDMQHIESATSGSASVGWGPFSISGSYAHSESHDGFTSTYDSGKLIIPGMQIVAWVNAITPASPPMADPTLKAEPVPAY